MSQTPRLEMHSPFKENIIIVHQDLVIPKNADIATN